MTSLRTEERAAPELVTLGVRPGHEPSSKLPVRIFLGTEPRQHRAERVFVWSIEQVRDPARVYEIHLMKSLRGFRRLGWTTGFTNYRCAIPHYAGGVGRAIYNDEDQIYLRDPAELFDLDLGDHGFLSVAPDDTSVMLMDCARMAETWPFEAARTESKAALLRRATGVAGNHGPLDESWNARDGEYREGRSRCLHFTNLHTQPWAPFPERFVYQEHPQGHLWFDLERSADEARFEIFTRERPSSLYRALGSDPPLDQVPTDDLPWVLGAKLDAAGPVHLEIACDPPGGVRRGPDRDRDQARTASWWVERLDDAARLRPGVRWTAELRGPDDARRIRSGGPAPGGAPPRVWVLADDRPGNTTQAIGLAEVLGWPFELKRLVPGPLSRLHNRILGGSLRGIDLARSDPLGPPWPDLVIAAGRRTAPVSLALREASAGAARLVHLGRKGADHAALFDLTMTPAYAGLFPHPRRLVLDGPLHGVTPERIAEARVRWKDTFETLPAPRIALLVGGTSGQYRIDGAIARRVGEAVARRAREAGGSVLVSTSRRTGDAGAHALRTALEGIPSHFHGAGGAGENPYLGYLAWADELVVTADSESMLVECASLGKPLSIHPLPERTSFRLLRSFREAVLRRARAQPLGKRGTGRPQQGLELLCARLIERGWVRPARDLALLHADLQRRGVAVAFGEPPVAPAEPPASEAPRAVARVRTILGLVD
ncbi:MAG: ELM1/GtrOC1 family putative glycosyltransferase [Myxococcota bacterium]